jgi:ATP adenylyltransferase
MKNLWTPWRRAYVSGTGEQSSGCVLCEALARRGEPDSLVLHVGVRSFVLMNLYPYNSGHLMIAPREHVADLSRVAPEVLSELMQLTQLAERVLSRRYRPHGFNLGMNLGRAAGAGVPDHLHLHLVPRWEADTNFMAVFGEVRVIPEDLREAARELREEFLRETAGAG